MVLLPEKSFAVTVVTSDDFILLLKWKVSFSNLGDKNQKLEDPGKTFS